MIHLTRIDPARNMARFYTMALQPTLFGDLGAAPGMGSDRQCRPARV
jgi:predicted DNA-binding WGR domain protein